VIGATGLVGLALVEQLEQTPEFEAITVVLLMLFQDS
jgi:aspartate-semialdehyde dehydrogenase